MKRTATATKLQTSGRGNKRKDQRDTVAGNIALVFADTNATTGLREVQGYLLDHSARGFRAEHEYPGLTCGQMVQYHLPASSAGQARVVWTRINGARVESGFFIVA